MKTLKTLLITAALAPSLALASNVNMNSDQDCASHQDSLESLSNIQRYLCQQMGVSSATECKKYVINASVNGTDDRFTREEMGNQSGDTSHVAEAFNHTGQLISTDANCPVKGSGFINEGKLTTARHVLCDMIEYNCDMSKLALKNDTLGWIHEIQSVTPETVQCGNKVDILTLNFKKPLDKKGLRTANKNELVQIARSSNPNCHVIGQHGDTNKMQASHVRVMAFSKFQGVNSFAHCADTFSGSSGGGLVCQVNGQARVIGVSNTHALGDDENEYVGSCDRASLSENGNWATYLSPRQEI